MLVPSAPSEPVPVPPSGLSESIFEISRTSRSVAGETISSTSTGSGPKADPTVPALALAEATEQAVMNLGSRNVTEISAQSVSDEKPAPKTADLKPRTGTFGGGDIQVGKVISSRLEIVADLGAGPLGRVFKAVDRKKGTTVAVKAIPAHRLPAAALAGRFSELVALLKGLTHPNLVKVHGAGREGDTAFTIMQYLEGLPLRALLEVKKENGAVFGFDEAEPIIAQICQGLQFAHSHATGGEPLLHGGLKPENVFVQVDSLKLLDFATSRLFSTIEWRDLQAKSKGGGYLAPEWGNPKITPDRRADVYSIGAILYEMLTGRPPAGPDSAPVSGFNPSVPRAVDRVVAKAMAARPEERYDTAAELKEAVFRVLGGDILADDIESPIGELGETFAEPVDDDEPGLDIEYLPAEQPVGLGEDRRSDDMTPVGAIELHEPLWEPDEIKPRVPSGERPAAPPLPPAPPPRLEISIPVEELVSKQEPPRPPVIAAPPPFAAAIAVPSSSAPRAEDRPTNDSAENTSLSGLQSEDHKSVDLDLNGEDATVAGQEPSRPPDRPTGPTPSWLDRVEEPHGRVAPRASAPAEISLGGMEGSPLELDKPTDAPNTDAPTIRRPTPTPAPWDPNRARAADPLPPADRPTDRPTAPPRPRDDNPSHRALSPPSPPPLELSFPTGPVPQEPRNQQTEPYAGGRPPRPAEPIRPAPSAVRRAPLLDDPTSPPKPTFIARRRKSNAPFFVLFVVAAASIAAIGVLAWPRLASFVPRGGDAPPGMVAISGGTFRMGSDRDDPDRDVYEAVLEPKKVAAFYIDRYEFPNQEGEMPMTGVDAATAASECKKAGKRLCTEDEWERACKGASGTRFPYGDSFKAGVCNVGGTDAPGDPKAIGSFASCGAPDGPRDMSGNVWELTSSRWPEDPDAHVLKGGSSRLPSWGARCAYRDSSASSSEAGDVGFRCCKSAGK